MKNKRAQIARMWHGIVSTEKADDYFEYLQQTGLKDYRNVDGSLAYGFYGELKMIRYTFY